MSKLLLKTATVADVHQVAQSLSEISRAEMVYKFGAEWWHTIRVVKDFLTLGPGVTLLEDDRPVCVFGHFPKPEGGRVTWFLSTDRYFALGARGVVFTRRYLDGLRRAWPGEAFHSYSSSPHPDVWRWFKLLGYTQIGDSSPGYRHFVLPPLADERRDAPSRA